MPPLLPMIKLVLKAEKSSAGTRVESVETACGPKWTTWLIKYKDVTDKHAVMDCIGCGETDKSRERRTR